METLNLSLLLGGSIIVVIILLFAGHYFRSFDVNRISSLSSTLQNIVLALSVVVAGVWTLYTFDALESKEQAIISKEKAEAELKEFRRQISETSSSTIEIKTKTIPYNSPYDKTQKGLIIEVTITNKGNSKIEYDLKNSPLTIYKIDASQDKLGYTKLLKPSLYKNVAPLKQNEIKSKPLHKWVSLANSSRTLSYFVTVENASMYYIVFSSPEPLDESSENNQEKCLTIDKCSWFVSKYVYIEDTGNDVSD
ncbi:hypothetical protein ACFOEW_03430 [Alteromonas oceani]|uniref:DUF4352 domain-containing protein n=1 Tax=Alteromonas oceani TaxID=2071609 RepID=A0ABV7JXI3_9ALTE|nr:hypothetical protein [Alteromonas oceani]